MKRKCEWTASKESIQVIGSRKTRENDCRCDQHQTNDKWPIPPPFGDRQPVLVHTDSRNLGSHVATSSPDWIKHPKQMHDEDASKRLVRIVGIGHWCAGIFGSGSSKESYLPVGHAHNGRLSRRNTVIVSL